ncbi:beta-glucosidase 8 [Quercus suber]|uniref:Beta-glucosidase 8 n=1 Tax=Quercus suber TaxID=58331 RepID=A0AAW0KYI6_QUESU
MNTLTKKEELMTENGKLRTTIDKKHSEGTYHTGSLSASLNFKPTEKFPVLIRCPNWHEQKRQLLEEYLQVNEQDVIQHWKCEKYHNAQTNGQRTRRNSTLEDWPRVKYLHGYIGSLLDALRNGSNTRGYFTWSFLDLFEMLDGYESSYGLYFVDLDDPDLKGQPKLSAHWYSNFLKGKNISSDGYIELQRNISAVSPYLLERKMLRLVLLTSLAALILGTDTFSRDDFPPDFVFGAASSAYQEDVQLMKDMGLEAYRFSISWSRLILSGRGAVNPKGLQYYNNLINELISHGIQPHVTLHHFDLPQALEDEYGGWVSRKIVYGSPPFSIMRHFHLKECELIIRSGCRKDFTAYADVCFRKFGDRVSYWTTMNEANMFDKQHGVIGLNVFSYWFVPQTNSTEDKIATQRAHDFYLGWFVNPLVFGDYPQTMKKIVKGSFDFIGVNHYFTAYVKDNPSSVNIEDRDVMADMAVQLTRIRNDTSTFEFAIVPWGLQGILEYIKQVYGNPPVYIHENGQRTRRNSTLEDWPRVKYLHGYIGGLLDAVRNGSNTRGYFTWSFLDLFEVADGYESSYGLYFVDLDDPDLKRQPKLSAHWYSNFLKGKNISSDGYIELQKNLSAVSTNFQ